MSITLTPLCAPRAEAPRPKWRHALLDRLSRTPLDPYRKDVRARALPASDRLTPILPWTPGPSVALYAHYNPGHRVTAMVQRQLHVLRQAGFAVLFITMSPIAHPGDLEALRAMGIGVVQRQSFGRDFGAWRDAWQSGLPGIHQAQELLLVNDSVLGPVYPLDPVFAAMRSGGEGVFGLTDSPARTPHLQSYFLLFRGVRAQGALGAFFAALRPSYVRRIMVRRGEIALAQALTAAGIPQWSCFGYEALEAEILHQTHYVPDIVTGARKYLKDPSGITHRLETAPRDASLDPKDYADLRHATLNPTLHFWRILLERQRYPFIKTELLRGQAKIPNVAVWPDLIPADAPVGVADITDHLETL